MQMHTPWSCSQHVESRNQQVKGHCVSSYNIKVISAALNQYYPTNPICLRVLPAPKAKKYVWLGFLCSRAETRRAIRSLRL